MVYKLIIMKSMLMNRVTALFVASFFALVSISCVQEEYEISEENLNLEVTVFQEGVTLPLGSTSAIKVSELLGKLDPGITEMFPVGADGTYAFGMSGSYPFSDQLSFLTESFSVPGFSTEESFPFNFSDVNVSNVSIPQIDVPYEQNLSSVIPSVDLDFPIASPAPFQQTADISGYLPEDLDVDIKDYTCNGVFATLEPVAFDLSNPILAPFADLELPISSDDPSTQTISSVLKLAGVTGFSIETIENIEINNKIDIPVQFKLPKMITAVNGVQFDKDAKVRISLDLSDNLFFTSGKIIPHVDLDIHEIFHLTDEANSGHTQLTIDHIVDDFILTGEGENPYSASNEYGIKSLTMEKGDFTKDQDGNLVFDKTISIVPDLSFRYEDLKTSLAKLSTHEGGPVSMTLKVEFLNFKVGNVEVAVEPVTTTVSTDFDLTFSQKLPDLVSGVQSVSFAEGSGLSLDIEVANLKRISGLDLAIESVDMEFPEGIQVKGADASGKLSLPVGSLADGKTMKKVEVTGIEFDPASQEAGNVAFSGKVKIGATAVASVKDGKFINTKDLPTEASQNIVLGVTPSASLAVSDFKVDFDGYYYEIEEEEVIEFEVSKEVADLGKVVIIPETEDGKEPVITIDIELPDTKLPIGPSSDKPLVIDFPDMVVFKDIPAEIKPYWNDGKLTFTGKLPSGIELPIDYIEAEAVKTTKWDEKTQENVEAYVVRDAFKVGGKVGVAPGVVVKADVDALTAPGAKVAFKAFVPKMVPSTVNIDMYQVEIPEQTIDLGDAISLSSLPEELVAVGEILLKDVALEIDVKAPGIDGLIKDADVTLDLDVALPEMIMLETPLEDGVLEVTGKLVGDEIAVEPVKVLGLKIDKKASELSDYLKTMKVTYGGAVTIKNASLDLDGFSDIALDVDVSLMTAGTENKIDISKVTGNVDYSVDPITVDVDLSSLTGALEDDNLDLTLDLNRFSLALEVNTNLAIPIIADLAVTPYKDDVAGTPLALPEPLKIEVPETSGEPALIRYWISNFEGEDPYMPEGYEHVTLDILSLIADSPDRLELSLNAGTDAESEASIVASENGPVLDVSYAFSLPFEFGEDMKVEFSEVIPDLPEELGTILQYGSLGLVGEIESSLPIELEMTYNFLDSNGNRIDLVENAGKQTIKPGTISGEAVKTDLNIIVGVKKGADLSDIDALELVFKAKSVAGAPIKDDSYIKAKLQALVPEGITLDLKDFMSNE